MSAIGIATLSARPDLLAAAARLNHETWWREEGPGLAEIEAGLRNPAEAFESWIATPPEAAAGEVCGMALLVACDLESRRDLTPWLASLVVLPAYRHQGLGSRLVRAVEAGAAERGFERLYLYTRDSQAFYRRLGWRDLEEALARDRPATIMDRALIRSTRTD